MSHSDITRSCSRAKREIESVKVGTAWIFLRELDPNVFPREHGSTLIARRGIFSISVTMTYTF